MLGYYIDIAGSNSFIRTKGFALITGAVSGGIGSVLGGGNFWMGAGQGLIVTAFNFLAHRETINSENENNNSEDPDQQKQKQQKTYEEKLRQRLSKLKIGDKIPGSELNPLDPNAGLGIDNIEKISNTKYKVNRTYLGAVSGKLDKNTYLIINLNGELGNYKGILINKVGSGPFELEFTATHHTHSYNTFLVSKSIMYYKFNNQIYQNPIK